MDGIRRVLFVCVGNTCRSQMAEGFLRAYGGDGVVVRSAG
jgi:arsenate reductase